MIAAPRRARLSFGQFEVDLDSGEIRRAGMRVRLASQPFRVLTSLLARPGDVVSHEQLQQEIWGANTNIDFERGIAGAINKVREALGDSADNPRFIETLAKRGYRFIAPVVIEALSPAADVQVPAPMPMLAPSSLDVPQPPARMGDLPASVQAGADYTTPDLLATLPTGMDGQRTISQRWRGRRLSLSFVVTLALTVATLASWTTYEVNPSSDARHNPAHRTDN